jgi:Domain of unknown function (DUF4402)
MTGRLSRRWRKRAQYGVAAAVSLCATGTMAGTFTGTTTVNVIPASLIYKIEDLRFGGIFQPTSINRVTIDENTGARTATQGAASLVPSPPSGRALFTIVGTPNVQVRVTTPASMTVTRAGGGATMTINQVRNSFNGNFITLPANGQYSFGVGGRLNVDANQALGVYTGTFTVTAVYQ